MTDVVDNRAVSLGPEERNLVLVSGAGHHVLVIERCCDICHHTFKRWCHKSLFLLNVIGLPDFDEAITTTCVDQVTVLVEG